MRKYIFVAGLLVFLSGCSVLAKEEITVSNVQNTLELDLEQKDMDEKTISQEADTLLYAICINEKWGIIDGTGEIKVEPNYPFSAVLDNGIYMLSSDSQNINKGKIYNHEGKLLFEDYGDITIFGGGPDCDSAYVETRAFLYEKNGLKGVILADGTVITEALYDDVRADYSQTFFVTLKDNKVGVVTLEGELVPPIYDEYPRVLGLADNVQPYTFTSGLVDGEIEVYKEDKKITLPSQYYLEQMQGFLCCYTPEGIITMDEDLNILHHFNSDITNNLEGPDGCYSLFGLLNISNGAQNAVVNKYGNFIIPFGDYWINGKDGDEKLLYTMKSIDDSVVDYYNLKGEFLYTSEYFESQIVESKKEEPVDTVFSLGLSPYYLEHSGYFSWATDGTHGEDIMRKIRTLMSSDIKGHVIY